jgi:RNA polymerase sigma-70 factor (ECF subfamily)
VSYDHALPLAETTATGFRGIYEANVGMIYRFIYSKVGNREEAEDLTAQVFAKAVHGLDWSRPDAMQRQWLFQVARTTMIDHWRATRHLPTHSLDRLLASGWEGPPITTTSPVDVAPDEKVMRILAQLPTHYRDVLTCRFLLNMSIKETATHLGMTEANVKVIQLRAIRRAAELKIDQREAPANG